MHRKKKLIWKLPCEYNRKKQRRRKKLFLLIGILFFKKVFFWVVSKSYLFVLHSHYEVFEREKNPLVFAFFILFPFFTISLVFFLSSYRYERLTRLLCLLQQTSGEVWFLVVLKTSLLVSSSFGSTVIRILNYSSEVCICLGQTYHMVYLNMFRINHRVTLGLIFFTVFTKSLTNSANSLVVV